MKKLKRILVVDTETNGLSPEEHSVIEIGYVLWSVEHRTMLEVYSGLLEASENEVESVNGIPAAVLKGHDDFAWEMVAGAAARADAIVAHNAEFDKKFVLAHGVDAAWAKKLVWICTIEDFEWPKESAKNLSAIALAHGVGLVAAHRAVNDCLTLARLFERLDDVDLRLQRALEQASKPKSKYISLAPFVRKDEVKAAGFRWQPDEKIWTRTMADDDVKKLKFPVKRVENA